MPCWRSSQFCPPVLSAARITLRDGSVMYGQFISGTSQTIVFQDDNGVRRRFDVNQVQNIDFGGVNTSANRYNDNANRDNPNRDTNRRDDSYQQPPVAPNNNNTAYRNDNSRFGTTGRFCRPDRRFPFARTRTSTLKMRRRAAPSRPRSFKTYWTPTATSSSREVRRRR